MIGTIVLYADEKWETSVHNQLVRSVEYREHLDMMYMATDDITDMETRLISLLYKIR